MLQKPVKKSRLGERLECAGCRWAPEFCQGKKRNPGKALKGKNKRKKASNKIALLTQKPINFMHFVALRSRAMPTKQERPCFVFCENIGAAGKTRLDVGRLLLIGIY